MHCRPRFQGPPHVNTPPAWGAYPLLGASGCVWARNPSPPSRLLTSFLCSGSWRGVAQGVALGRAHGSPSTLRIDCPSFVHRGGGVVSVVSQQALWVPPVFPHTANLIASTLVAHVEGSSGVHLGAVQAVRGSWGFPAWGRGGAAWCVPPQWAATGPPLFCPLAPHHPTCSPLTLVLPPVTRPLARAHTRTRTRATPCLPRRPVSSLCLESRPLALPRHPPRRPLPRDRRPPRTKCARGRRS